MFVEYRHAETALHRLDPRAKLVAFAAAVAGLFLFRHPLPNLAFALAAFGLLAWVRVPWPALRRTLAPLGVVLVLIVVFTSVSYGPDHFTGDARQVLVHLWPGGHLPVTLGGIAVGATLALRILTMVALTTALTVSTPVEAFVAVLRQARVPFPLVLVAVTALRLVPTMQRRADQILAAQQARGARLHAGGPIGRVRAHIPVMVPLLAGGIRSAEDLAAAMMVRGYGAVAHPTSLVRLRARPVDVAVAAASLLALGGLVALRTAGWWTL